MMMKKFALALMLALACADTFASNALLLLRPPAKPEVSLDGVSRRARAARGVRRKTRPTSVTARRGGRARNVSAITRRTPLLPSPDNPPVREIDGEGLKNLLRRGEGEAARPLLVNFWATWCGPCRKEFPDLVRVEADYRGRGLEFALVSADDVTEIKTAVPKFLRQMRAAALPAYLLNAADTEAAIAQVDPAWGGELPATFLFDRQGKLAYRHFGIINPAELRAEIDKVISDN